MRWVVVLVVLLSSSVAGCLVGRTDCLDAGPRSPPLEVTPHMTGEPLDIVNRYASAFHLPNFTGEHFFSSRQGESHVFTLVGDDVWAELHYKDGAINPYKGQFLRHPGWPPSERKTPPWSGDEETHEALVNAVQRLGAPAGEPEKSGLSNSEHRYLQTIDGHTFTERALSVLERPDYQDVFATFGAFYLVPTDVLPFSQAQDNAVLYARCLAKVDGVAASYRTVDEDSTYELDPSGHLLVKVLLHVTNQLQKSCDVHAVNWMQVDAFTGSLATSHFQSECLF